jgi:hypothetical protein
MDADGFGTVINSPLPYGFAALELRGCPRIFQIDRFHVDKGIVVARKYHQSHPKN